MTWPAWGTSGKRRHFRRPSSSRPRRPIVRVVAAAPAAARVNGRLDAHDDYCPWVRGDKMKLDWRPAPAKDLMRSGNVCTTVVV